jgi:hypothetical protein
VCVPLGTSPCNIDIPASIARVRVGCTHDVSRPPLYLQVSLLCTRNDSSGIHSHEKIPYNVWTLFHNTNSHTTRSKGKGRKAVACAVIPATGNRRTAAAIPRSHFFTGVAVDLNRLAEYASSRNFFCEKSHCLAQQKFSK